MKSLSEIFKPKSIKEIEIILDDYYRHNFNNYHFLFHIKNNVREFSIYYYLSSIEYECKEKNIYDPRIINMSTHILDILRSLEKYNKFIILNKPVYYGYKYLNFVFGTTKKINYAGFQ